MEGFLERQSRRASFNPRASGDDQRAGSTAGLRLPTLLTQRTTPQVSTCYISAAILPHGHALAIFNNWSKKSTYMCNSADDTSCSPRSLQAPSSHREDSSNLNDTCCTCRQTRMRTPVWAPLVDIRPPTSRPTPHVLFGASAVAVRLKDIQECILDRGDVARTRQRAAIPLLNRSRGDLHRRVRRGSRIQGLSSAQASFGGSAKLPRCAQRGREANP